MPEHLSPRRLAAAVGVSESSIKRWVDDGRIASSLTAGGHRRIPLAAAIRFVRESRSDLVDGAALGLASGGPDGLVEDPGETLFDHMLHGRADDAVSLARALFLSGMEAAKIVDEHLRRATVRCGELWHERGDEGVFLEHRATQIGLRLLQELRAMQSALPANAPLAIGGAPGGDPYQVPTLAVAAVLESVGFATSNLGPETPVGAFVSAIDNLRPDLVWLSVTSDCKPEVLRSTIRTLSEAARPHGGSVVLGGRACAKLTLEDDGASFLGESMVELVAFAKGLLHSIRLSTYGTRPTGGQA